MIIACLWFYGTRFRLKNWISADLSSRIFIIVNVDCARHAFRGKRNLFPYSGPYLTAIYKCIDNKNQYFLGQAHRLVLFLTWVCYKHKRAIFITKRAKINAREGLLWPTFRGTHLCRYCAKMRHVFFKTVVHSNKSVIHGSELIKYGVLKPLPSYWPKPTVAQQDLYFYSHFHWNVSTESVADYKSGRGDMVRSAQY